MKRLGAFLSFIIIFLSGCSTIGPNTVPRDRFNYNVAISDSWKEQALLNIVKLRYADMPLFVEVASVVSGYTLEGSVNVGGKHSSGNLLGNTLSVGAASKYTDRPTITYAPITGAKFNESFMTPIPPKSIMFLMESGWSAEMVLPLVLDGINGLRSRVAGGKNARMGDPGFYRVIDLMHTVQESGYTSMRIVRGEDSKETTVIFFYRDNLPKEIDEALKDLEKLLGIRPNSREIKVTYGIIPETDQEVALKTRSMLQIMVALAAGIVVPPEHVEEGRTNASLMVPGSEEIALGNLVNIHATTERPENDYVSVKYKDYWFWIDDRDFNSKRAFTFVMVLFSLTESGGKEGLPLVTIPAG